MSSKSELIDEIDYILKQTHTQVLHRTQKWSRRVFYTYEKTNND